MNETLTSCRQLGAQQTCKSNQYSITGKLGCWRWREYNVVHRTKQWKTVVGSRPRTTLLHRPCHHHFS